MDEEAFFGSTRLRLIFLAATYLALRNERLTCALKIYAPPRLLPEVSLS